MLYLALAVAVVLAIALWLLADQATIPPAQHLVCRVLILLALLVFVVWRYGGALGAGRCVR
jgi:hypothetical protein